VAEAVEQPGVGAEVPDHRFRHQFHRSPQCPNNARHVTHGKHEKNGLLEIERHAKA